MTSAPAPLARRLGTTDAVVVGLSAMLGAGVYSAFSPAAGAAGSWLLVGLLVAAGVAYCNATASAQLAAQYPLSGGTYVYGRERLGPVWGFLAGWGFVVGKTASCAAMAVTFAVYVVPGHALVQRLLGVAAVVFLVVVNLLGVTRTARLARVLLAVTLLALTVAVVVALRPGASSGRAVSSIADVGPYGVLQAAGLLFFAFAGYARIATLGEEVRDPRRAIPRAIVTALAITTVVYLVVGLALLHVLGPAGVAADATPVTHAVRSAGAAWAVPVVTVGAAAGSLGSLLALLAGVSRTALAMARERDLPHGLSRVGERHAVPDVAIVTVGLAVVVLVLVADLRGVIGFSSFGVLTYYGVANAAAWTQDAEHRRWPRWLQVVGLAGCAVLAVTLPWRSAALGATVLVVGLVLRAVLVRSSAAAPE